MNRKLGAFALLVLCIPSMASSCSDEPPVGPPEKARLMLDVPGTAESGLVIRLVGAAGLEAEPADPSHRLFQNVSGDDLVVAIVGTIDDGLILELADVEGAPAAVIEQVAAPDFSLRDDLSGYAVSWE